MHNWLSNCIQVLKLPASKTVLVFFAKLCTAIITFPWLFGWLLDYLFFKLPGNACQLGSFGLFNNKAIIRTYQNLLYWPFLLCSRVFVMALFLSQFPSFYLFISLTCFLSVSVILDLFLSLSLCLCPSVSPSRPLFGFIHFWAFYNFDYNKRSAIIWPFLHHVDEACLCFRN